MTRALGYIRVSTDEQAESGGGLEAQRTTITKWCDYKQFELLEIVLEGEKGARSTAKVRADLEATFDRMDSGAADVLIVAKLDRMARSAGETERMLDRARRRGWVLVPLDIGVDTTTPMGEAFTAVTAVFARLERRQTGLRTKDAIAAKKEAGTLRGPLGRPRLLPDEVAERIERERIAGSTLQAIADGLTADGVATAHGGVRWHKQTVAAVLARVEPVAPAV